jgi:hypothetical protein
MNGYIGSAGAYIHLYSYEQKKFRAKNKCISHMGHKAFIMCGRFLDILQAVKAFDLFFSRKVVYDLYNIYSNP